MVENRSTTGRIYSIAGIPYYRRKYQRNARLGAFK
jgi:hypothetical protein